MVGLHRFEKIGDQAEPLGLCSASHTKVFKLYKKKLAALPPSPEVFWVSSAPSPKVGFSGHQYEARYEALLVTWSKRYIEETQGKATYIGEVFESTPRWHHRRVPIS